MMPPLSLEGIVNLNIYYVDSAIGMVCTFNLSNSISEILDILFVSLGCVQIGLESHVVSLELILLYFHAWCDFIYKAVICYNVPATWNFLRQNLDSLGWPVNRCTMSCLVSVWTKREATHTQTHTHTQDHL